MTARSRMDKKIRADTAKLLRLTAKSEALMEEKFLLKVRLAEVEERLIAQAMFAAAPATAISMSPKFVK